MYKIIGVTFFMLCIINNTMAQDSLKSADTQKKQIDQQKQKESSQKFVDLDGDGFNDNAPDHDGDGIPNGLDPDWQKENEKFVDLDGDGINDNNFQEQNRQRQNAFGPGTRTQDSKGTPQVKSEEQKQQHKGKKGKK